MQLFLYQHVNNKLARRKNVLMVEIKVQDLTIWVVNLEDDFCFAMKQTSGL